MSFSHPIVLFLLPIPVILLVWIWRREAARVVLATALIANVGRLMEKYPDDLDRLGDFFEVPLLQSGGSSGGSGGGELEAPTNLDVQFAPAGALSATWDAVDGAALYVVEQLEVGVDPDFTEAGVTNAPNLTFGGYNPGTTVQVRVRARGEPGPSGTPEGPNSAVVEVTVP